MPKKRVNQALQRNTDEIGLVFLSRQTRDPGKRADKTLPLMLCDEPTNDLLWSDGPAETDCGCCFYHHRRRRLGRRPHAHAADTVLVDMLVVAMGQVWRSENSVNLLHFAAVLVSCYFDDSCYVLEYATCVSWDTRKELSKSRQQRLLLFVDANERDDNEDLARNLSTPRKYEASVRLLDLMRRNVSETQTR